MHPRRVPSRRAGRRLGACAAALGLALVLNTTATAAPPPAQPPERAGVAAGGIGTYPLAALASLLQPDAAPPGANVWTCKPSAARPRPVVLLHGTYSNSFAVWNKLAPILKADGYCVFTLNYGGGKGNPAKGGAHIPDSAKELAAFVDSVLKATGARQVDLVGHSQGGGPLPRWYLKFAGGANAADPAKNKVRRLIGLAPSNHGAQLLGLSAMVAELKAMGLVGTLAGAAVADQLTGSEFNTTLDRGGDTLPGIDYTVIATRGDEVLDQPQHHYLTAGPGAKVTNVTVQDRCALDFSAHFDIPYDSNVLTLVRNALDPEHPQQLVCKLVLPVLGG